MNVCDKYRSISKKIPIVILSLGLIGCILLSFDDVKNHVIAIAEKLVLGRMINNPDRTHALLSAASFLGSFFCLALIISTILRFKKLSPWDILSQIVIMLSLAASLGYAIAKADFWGEADSYIIATISIQQHCSLDIRDTDIRQFEAEGYPGFLVEETKNKFENRHYINDIYGRQYPWYMGTYSASIFPIKIINRLFNIPQTYVYHASNVLYYSLALLAVYLFFKQARINVFLAVLLLSCSPAFVYISWVSAEVFIYSLITVSLVFFINGNRHLAAFFMSVAATMNITICAFSLIIIADYFFSVYNNEKKLGGSLILTTAIRRNWKKTLAIAICFFPALITPLWNLYHYHKITPQLSMARYDYFWLKRFVAYLFDLNFGFLPYFPILLLLFFCTVIAGICKRKRQTILPALGFFIIVFLYSAMEHINSGMTAMARYNVWSAPFLAITVVSQTCKLFKKIQRHIILLLLLSAGTTLALTITVMGQYDGNYLYFTPLARFFMDKAPALYNPYPFTFISRLLNYDGGNDYDARAPFIYFSSEGHARKILIPPGCNDPAASFADRLSASENDMNWLNEQALNLKRKRPAAWVYINIAPKRSIVAKIDNSA